jgi:hypothetical protein
LARTINLEAEKADGLERQGALEKPQQTEEAPAQVGRVLVFKRRP